MSKHNENERLYMLISVYAWYTWSPQEFVFSTSICWPNICIINFVMSCFLPVTRRIWKTYKFDNVSIFPRSTLDKHLKAFSKISFSLTIFYFLLSLSYSDIIPWCYYALVREPCLVFYKAFTSAQVHKGLVCFTLRFD